MGAGGWGWGERGTWGRGWGEEMGRAWQHEVPQDRVFQEQWELNGGTAKRAIFLASEGKTVVQRVCQSSELQTSLVETTGRSSLFCRH